MVGGTSTHSGSHKTLPTLLMETGGQDFKVNLGHMSHGKSKSNVGIQETLPKAKQRGIEREIDRVCSQP